MSSIIDMVNASMHSDMSRLQSIGQNVANANTVGYKKLLVAQPPVITETFSASLAEQDDYSVMAGSSGRDISGSAIKPTDNPYDIALEGEHLFFVLKNLIGGEVFSRRGDFSLDGKGRLVLDDGIALQGVRGDIVLNGSSFQVGKHGEVIQDGREVDRIKMAVLDLDAAQYIGRGIYHGDARDLPAMSETGVRQGVLETSNVDTTSEMLSLMEVMRKFETSSKVLLAYDGLLGKTIENLG